MEEEIIEPPLEPKHILITCLPDNTTYIQTSAISYIYTCPECGLNRRYAVPKNDEFIGCEGNDLGLYKIN